MSWKILQLTRKIKTEIATRQRHASCTELEGLSEFVSCLWRATTNDERFQLLNSDGNCRHLSSLPAETADFSGLDKFNNSVSNMFLLKFCQVNFEWYTETYIYVHNSIVFMIAMFKLFYNTTAACQRPVGHLLSNKCMHVARSNYQGFLNIVLHLAP